MTKQPISKPAFALFVLAIFLYPVANYVLAGDAVWTTHEGDSNAYGHYYMTSNSTASAAITVGVPVEIGGTATAGAASGFTIATASGGRATYTGAEDIDVLVTVGLSMTSTKSNETMRFYVAENGTPVDASRARRKIGTGTDLGRGASNCILTLSTNDYVEIFVDLEASTGDTVTAKTMQLSVTQVSN